MSHEGRDEKGRFVKGHSVPGGGRKPAVVETAYMDAFREVVTISKWKRATRAILKRAMDGDIRAYECLAKYAMRFPIQVEITRTAVMSLNTWKEQRETHRREIQDLVQ